MYSAISGAVMLIDILDWSIFDSFPIDIHRIAFEVVLARRAAHEFADTPDLGHVEWDSNDSTNLSTVECVACWRWVLIPFRWNCADPHTMDFDTVQLTH